MKYLKIQNNGLLDPRLVSLMGGTTKSKDQFKIGQFGSGLKYTLAFLYRNNLSFKIFCGEEEVKMHTETEVIRNEDFEIICINGQRTSITTRMGEDWEAWMIVRELWCNALDEGGALKEVTDNAVGEPSKTTFYIQEDIQIRNVLKDWNKYFIHDQQAISKNGAYTIYPAGNHLCLYKQGVLIHENDKIKSLFSYDIGNAEINELREFKGSVSCEIAMSMYNANETAIEYLLANITDDHFEGSMDWDWFSSFGESWKNVIGNAKIIYKKVLEDIEARGNYPDRSTLIIVPKNLFTPLSKQFDGISAVYVAGQSGHFYEDYNEKMEGKLKQGLTILEHCDYIVHPELKFMYGFFEDKRILAQINIKEKIIRVSNTLLQKSLFCVVGMLIEENEHFNTGMDDNTREFQQHFIDLYTRALLAKNEVEI